MVGGWVGGWVCEWVGGSVFVYIYITWVGGWVFSCLWAVALSFLLVCTTTVASILSAIPAGSGLVQRRTINSSTVVKHEWHPNDKAYRIR